MQISNTIIPIIKLSPSPSTRDTDNHTSNSSRASDTLRQHNPCFHYASPRLCKRLLRMLPDIFSNILFQCNFRTILTFRLVSKEFCRLASTSIGSCPYTPLSAKADISFNYPDLNPTTNPLIEAKFHFAQKNTNTVITSSIQDLISSPLIDSIPEEKLKLILKITTLDELNQLQSLLQDQKYLKIINAIQGLNLCNLKIDPSTLGPIKSLLTTFSQNSILSSNLKSLSLKNTCQNLNLSKYSFTNLTSLSLGSIEPNTRLNLSHCSLDKLRTLSLGTICRNTKVTLPHSLPNLTSLFFKNVCQSTKLDLSAYSFPNLKRLSFGCIEDYTTLDLSHYSLPKLRMLTFGNIYSNATLILPNSLPNLIILSLEYIFRNSSVTLSSFPKLRKFSVVGIEQNTTLDLSPYSFEKLRTLSLGTIERNVMLALPHLLPRLKNLTYKSDYRNLNERLPMLLLHLKLAIAHHAQSLPFSS